MSKRIRVCVCYISYVASYLVRCVLNLVSVAGVVAITKNTAVDLHLPSGEVGVGMTLNFLPCNTVYFLK
jgi:hypothetical protein